MADFEEVGREGAEGSNAVGSDCRRRDRPSASARDMALAGCLPAGWSCADAAAASAATACCFFLAVTEAWIEGRSTAPFSRLSGGGRLMLLLLLLLLLLLGLEGGEGGACGWWGWEGWE